MVRCQDCNSKVADNDLFCPYCGMVLKTAPGAGDVVPVDEVSVSATTEPNMEDVDVPGPLEDYARTSDNVMPPPTSEYAIIPDDAIEINEDMPAMASAPDESSEVSERPDEPIALSEGQDKPVELSEAGEDSPDEVVAAPESESIKAAEPESTSHEEEAHDEAPTVLRGGVFEERPYTREQGISKPAEDLEAAEAPKSMFDSVRIIESKPRPDDVDTRIQGISEPVPEPPTPAILTEQTNVEPKPYTEPNMGMGTGGDTDGKRSAKLKPLGEGTILNNRYEIVRKIGGGGMGAVYLASDNNLGGVLRAVKEMVQSHIEEEQQEKAINDFKRESMILSTLDHPSIPTIYDYFYDSDEGRFYLVMKYISGGDLASRLRSAPEGKIDEKSVTQWAVQITDVLDYLHNQPSTIVYRDLKPSNIMIDGNSGRIMLIDFGIARSISQKEEKGVTAVGTMGYAPPELFSGNVEPRSDIYSLGSTIFHLLTGADPQSNPLLIFDFQKNPRPRQINSQLSDQIERIIMRSVEYNSDSRFGSAAELKAVLEEHLENLRSGNVTYGVTAIPASISLENQSVFCGFCGQRIVATDLFCAFCGAKQPIAQQGVHSEIYTRSAPTAKLIIEGTSELTTPAFSLQKDENLVGRRDPMSNIFPEVDLSKYDPQTKISRRHARIWRDGSNFLVEDLGSSNGTILASAVTDSLRLIPHKPHILTSGDKLKVGDTTLHFLIG